MRDQIAIKRKLRAQPVKQGEDIYREVHLDILFHILFPNFS